MSHSPPINAHNETTRRTKSAYERDAFVRCLEDPFKTNSLEGFKDKLENLGVYG